MHASGKKPQPKFILCADWGKAPKKRSVYVADVSKRTVIRMPEPHNGWSFEEVRKRAEKCAQDHGGPVLATFDLPLGVPSSYLEAFNKLTPVRNFVEMLARTDESYFTPRSALKEWKEGTPIEWSVKQPFFAVPAGKGSLKMYESVLKRHQVMPWRQIEKKTRAKSVFITAGVAGTVGSGAVELWQELAPRLKRDEREFRLWPFDGALDTLLRQSPVVVGEIYPRATYAVALNDDPVGQRPPLSVRKAVCTQRIQALKKLQIAEWAKERGVHFGNVDEAICSDDDFDALITAAALLRLVCDGESLEPEGLTDAERNAEGSMLGVGSVNLQLKEKTFSA